MTTLDISEFSRSMGQFGRSLENLVRPAESFSRKSGGCSGGCRCGGGCGGSCGCSGGVAATDRGPGAYENGWGAVTGVRGEVQLHRVVETGRVSVPDAITAKRNIGAQPSSGCNHSPSTAQLGWSGTDHRWPEDETTTGGGPPGDCYCDFIADMIRDEIQWIHDHLDILTDDLYNWKVVDICEWLQRQWIICMYGHYGEKVYESPVWKRCVPPPCPSPRPLPINPPPPTNWDPWKHWCGGAWSNQFVPDWNLEWKHCCYLHDKCYGKGGTEADRRQCDSDFYKCLYPMSHAMAWIYWAFVRRLGSAHFNYHSHGGR